MAIDWDAAVLGPVMGVFGEGVTYRPLSGAAYALTDAVFDNAYSVAFDQGDGLPPLNSTGPALGVRRAAMAADPVKGDQVDMPVGPEHPVATAYLVGDVRPDGHGHFLLLLNFKATL